MSKNTQISEEGGTQSTNPATPEMLAEVGNLAQQPQQRFGRFIVRRFHAKGGLGEVHVAADEEFDREVALKRIQDRHLHNPDSRRRFLQEAAITAKLQHPGIVPIYGLAQGPDGQPCYAMRFIEGETLKEAIERFHGQKLNADCADYRRNQSAKIRVLCVSDFNGLEFRQLLQRFIAVCNTIAYAHSRGIIHRDIKPANVMLGKYGETLVVDWGLAKPFGRTETERASGEATLMPTPADSGDGTQMGQAVGTPSYMAPEQASGRWDAVGPCSDIFSLGATLYTALTGRAPIQGRDAFDVLDKARRCKYPTPRSARPRSSSTATRRWRCRRQGLYGHRASQKGRRPQAAARARRLPEAGKGAGGEEISTGC